MYVVLKSPSGQIKTIKWGVSWVYFFFGGWASLFQGRWNFFFFEIIATSLVAAAGTGAILITILHLYMFFLGNKGYARYLQSKGWMPATDRDAEIMRS